jgi:cell wall-associated NlpC family hydrolase
VPTQIQTPVGSAPVVPVVLIGIGAYLAWFGVHYFGSDQGKWPSTPVKAVLTGKPLPQPTGQLTTGLIDQQVTANSPSQLAGVGAGGSSTPTGNAISDDAMKYVGQGYVFGGPSQPGKWDCSSFVNYVVGHDLGLPIPGGSWAVVCGNGNSHGPATGSWLLFGQPVNLSQAQPGDVVVSVEHMGIVIGGGKMISAQDPQLGTGVASYLSGFPAGPPHVRRIAAPPTGTTQAPGTTTAGGRG